MAFCQPKRVLPYAFMMTFGIVDTGAYQLQASTLLAHFEFECVTDEGCSHSANTGSTTSFNIGVYPDSSDFGSYDPGSSVDVVIPIDEYLVDFLTSGSVAAPEPIEFVTRLIGAGGSGQGFDKSDLQAGQIFNPGGVRWEVGYDVPLDNGIDLGGTATPTDVRFQLFRLEVLNSNVLPGSALRTHFRYEFLGEIVPEPGGLKLTACLMTIAMLSATRMLGR